MQDFCFPFWIVLKTLTVLCPLCRCDAKVIIAPDPFEALFVSVMLRVADPLQQAFPLSTGVLVQEDATELHFGRWTETTRVSSREDMPQDMAGEGWCCCHT